VSGQFEREIARDDFFDALANQQLAEILKVWEAAEKQDAFDERIGMFHLVDGFLVLVPGKLRKTPVREHPGVQEILVDRRELVLENDVQGFDDFRIAWD
jgi:hypothetical protein